MNISNILDMSDTTNLADLPSDPHAGGGSENVVLQTSERTAQYTPTVEASNQPPASGIDEQKVMNEFVSGIQQASALSPSLWAACAVGVGVGGQVKAEA